MPEINTKIILTADGSHSLYREDIDESYHSYHGALQESKHVYIKMGLDLLIDRRYDSIRIFELGLGTHLNLMLTFARTRDEGLDIRYDSIEKYPIATDQLSQLNYWEDKSIKMHSEAVDRIIHADWNEELTLSSDFRVSKIEDDFVSCKTRTDFYDLFYFDAFGYRAQEELWTREIFAKCFSMLCSGGILVTYAAKGLVRRNMDSVGFKVERLEGAPGKREMLRATKP